ncbi:hypothetical protein P7C70_g4649, partial [Phenoliferia sp. Uapishka_3]
MEVARTPSRTPDLGPSRASFHIAIPPPVIPSVAIPPPRAAQREVLDLTGPSPPTRTRHFPDDSSDESNAQRRSKRARPNPRQAVRVPASRTETLVLSDSDDDDGDDDVIVVSAVAGPSGSAGSSNSASSSTGATVASSVGNGAAARRGGPHIVLPAGGRRGIAPLPAPAEASSGRLGIGGSFMSAIGRLTGAQRASPAPAAAAVRELAAIRRLPPSSTSRASSISSNSSATDDHAFAAHHGHGSSHADYIQQQVAAYHAVRNAGGGGLGMDYLHHLMGVGGGGSYDLPSGLQGVISNSWKKPAPAGKKFTVRMSHPKKCEEGFSRNIVNPPEEGETPPPAPSANKKGKKAATAPPVVEMEPGCASCLESLRLAQAGEGRIWALKCGHAVCGRCLTEAKARCEEIKAAERAAQWEMNVDEEGRSKEPIVLDGDDEGDEEPSAKGRSKGKGTMKGKGKEKSRADETGVEEAWTTCPVVSCDGALSDLLAKDDDMARPFEAYV